MIAIANRGFSARPRASVWAFALVLVAESLALVLIWQTGDDNVARRLVDSPVVFAAAPLMVPRQWVRVTAAAMMAVFCLLAVFSIGMFFVPALVALVVAAGSGANDRGAA